MKIKLPAIEKHIEDIVGESESAGEMKVKFTHLAEIIKDAAEDLTHKKEGGIDATASNS